jgi:plastocyanin
MNAKLLVLIALALAALGAWVLLSAERGPSRDAAGSQAETLRAVAPPLRLPGEARTYVVFLRVEGGRFFFDPAALHLEPGEEVLWVNLGDNHSTTAYHPANGKPLRIPEGADPWDSGILGLGDVGIAFSYTFRVEGTYDYFCMPHEFLGMVGRIVTGRPGGPAEATSIANADLPQAVREEMPSTTRALTGVGAWAAELNRGLWLLLRGEAEGAAGQAEALLRAFRRGEGRSGSLYSVLAKLEQADVFARLLGELRDLLAADADFREAERKTDRLKTLLSEAEEALLQLQFERMKSNEILEAS